MVVWFVKGFMLPGDYKGTVSPNQYHGMAQMFFEDLKKMGPNRETPKHWTSIGIEEEDSDRIG